MDRAIQYLDDFSRSADYPYDAAAAFGYGHDDLDSYIAQPFITAAEKATNASRTVRISNEEDFFQDIEKNYPNLPAQSVSFGNEWDLLCASMNETTAKVRRSTEKLRSAEALAAVVSLRDTGFASSLKQQRDFGMDGYGMYWEHNWTGDGPVSLAKRAAWQVKLQNYISNYVDTLQSLAIKKLGDELKKTGNPRFFVFNPLGWTRDGVADVFYDGKYPVKVIALSVDKELPVQKIVKDGQAYLRVKVSGVPPVGYKLLEIRPGRPAKLKAAAIAENGWISNSFYRVHLSRSGCYNRYYR